VAATNDDVYALTRTLWEISAILQRGMRQVVDPTRWAMLQFTATHGRARPSEIAKALNISASSVTRHAQALEQTASVEVVGDISDRRACLITITDKGRAELASVERAGIEYFAAELADWDADDVHTLTVLLARFRETLVQGHERRQAAKEARRRRRGIGTGDDDQIANDTRSPIGMERS
jgi:DNA-binding MarR family transcriptional regulator